MHTCTLSENKLIKLGCCWDNGSACVSHHCDQASIPAPCSCLIKITSVTCEKSVVQFVSTKHHGFSQDTLDFFLQLHWTHEGCPLLNLQGEQLMQLIRLSSINKKNKGTLFYSLYQFHYTAVYIHILIFTVSLLLEFCLLCVQLYSCSNLV